MASADKNIVYTAADIQRYLNGTMSNGERHAIERAALDDELLAEAIEGYASMQESDWANALDSLRSGIDEAGIAPVVSLNKQRKTGLWKAAAAILLLVTGAAAVYLFKTNKQPVTYADEHKKEQLASIDTVSQKQEDSVAGRMGEDLAKNSSSTSQVESKVFPKSIDSSTTIAKDQESLTDFVYTPRYKTQDKPLAGGGEDYNYRTNDNNVANVPDNRASNATAPSSKNLNLGNLSNQVSSSTEITDSLKYSQSTAEDKDGYNNFKAPVQNGRFNSFNGYVVTKDNSPLAFARISTGPNRQPIYTDKNGFFKITLPDTVLHAQVNSAGYASKTVSWSQLDADKKIVLEPLAVAESKLSSGKKKNSMVASNAKAEQQKEIEEQEEDEATPVIGWDDYNNYLTTNGSISDKSIHGVVEVFVNLDKNGSISKIKVDKSLCAECDAEAVRLLKEGPKWDVKSNKARRVKVKVKF